MANLLTPLFPHQIKHLQFALAHPRSGNWSDCGIGKTLIALSLFHIKQQLGLAKHALVVCPLSVITSWALEIEKHTTFTYAKLTGTVEQKVKTLLKKDKDIYLVTYDSIPFRRGTKPFVFMALKEFGFDLLVCDEITCIKNIQARRTRALIALCDNIENILFLSATPITQKVEDVFTIYRALDQTVFGEPGSAIRKYMYNMGYKYPNWKLSSARVKEFQNKIYSIAVRITKGECLTLPEKIWLPRFCGLDKQQREVYDQVVNDILVDLKVVRVNIPLAIGKTAKLSQVADGFIYAENKTYRLCDKPSKIDLLFDIINYEIPSTEKIIIYAHWREDIKIIEQYLTQYKLPYIVLHGGLSQKARTTAISTFANQPVEICKIMISQTEVGGFGLNLPQSANIIYYSLSFSLAHFIQSQDRIHRIGQTKPCRYFVLLVEGTIDLFIYQKILRGTEISKILLDERGIEELKQALLQSLQH